jgi:GH24 family phage-related lysozyme (muramidase)
MAESMSAEQWNAELEDRQKQRDFERHKFDREIQLREREVQLKENEVSTSTGRGLKMTGAQATVAAALLTLLGGTLGAVTQWKTANDTEAKKASGELAVEIEKSQATMDLERRKFESTLILKAVESKDEAERTRNLQFFLKAGFISDPEGKISRIRPEDYPSTYKAPPRELDLSDPAFSDFPKPLLDAIANLEGPRASPDDLRQALATVDRLVRVQLSDNQRSALAVLIYNIGALKFSRSTLLEDVNAGRHDRVLEDFVALAPANGIGSENLQNRRRVEASLFLATSKP